MKGQRKEKRSDKLTMLDHVKELRLRLLIVVVVLVLGGIVGYLFYEQILFWMKSPLVGDLYYSSPAGSFSFVMKIATMAGIALAVPVIVYQIIMFVRPALPKIFSRRRVAGYTGLSVALAIAGAAFGFYMILPGALHFFAGFQVTGLSALIGADSYLTFVTNVLITFMIVFQIPLLLVIIDHIKPINPKSLFKAEKYVILGGLLVSFFVPFALDIVTALLIATPIILLYNLSIGLIIWRHYWQNRKAVEHVAVQEQELLLDDEVVAAFFAEKSEPVPMIQERFVETPSTLPSLRGLAMEFQRSRQASIDELRLAIERERAQAIADKVARYNVPVPMKRSTDIR